MLKIRAHELRALSASWANFSNIPIKDIIKAAIWQNKFKIVSEYDQEIPQTQTADKPMAPRGRATQQSPDTRKTN